MKKYTLSLLILLNAFVIMVASAQKLQPGFDKEEYRQLMYLSARTGALSPDYYKDIPAPKEFKMIYRSRVMGLDNLWDLWTSDQRKVAVVSIRGTTDKPESWLANFYAAMVPAKGQLQLSKKDTFKYVLSTDDKAAVHVGWLLSLAYLSRDILPKIDSLYKAGTKEFILMGHSQGGAINFLLTAYLCNLQKMGKLPADIRFKTYCSAGPKPGNLYFAYEFESLTKNGWGFNVVNASDWVPETPMSIQTLNDFNQTNPFVNAKGMIKKQKFKQRMALKHVFKKLDKPTRKAQRNYEKYLGKMASKIIRQSLNDYIPAEYYKSNNYVRTGVTIVLMSDADYKIKYPEDPAKIFQHHFHHPYLLLLEKYDD
jgi:hypothetical protein